MARVNQITQKAQLADEYHALFGDLVAMEAYRRSLLEQASGDGDGLTA